MFVNSQILVILLCFVTSLGQSQGSQPSIPHVVRVPAHFIEKFSIISVKRGDTARIVCEAYGTRPITVQWLVQNPKTGDTSILPVNPGSSYAGVSFGPFKQPYNPPSLGTHPHHESRHYGRTDLDGQGNIGQTLLLSNRLNAFQKDYILGQSSSDDDKTVFELHITSTVLNDSATYACKVSNEFGDDVHNIELTILDVPSAPLNVSIDGVWSRGISVTWIPSRNDGNSLITEYIIQYWKEVSSTSLPSKETKDDSQNRGNNDRSSSSQVGTTPIMSMTDRSRPVTSDNGALLSSFGTIISTPSISVSSAMKEIEVSSSVTSHVISDKLTPGTSYCLRMYGSNENGRGSPSSIVRFTTNEEPPTMGPIDISVESKGSTILVIKWKAPPKETWNGILIGYRVGYRILSQHSKESINAGGDNDHDIDTIIAKNDLAAIEKVFTFKDVPASSSLVNSEEQQLILTGLSRDTAYVLVIQAYNSAGKGPFSQQVIVETSSNDPPEAPVLWVTGVTESSIKLKWDTKKIKSQPSSSSNPSSLSPSPLPTVSSMSSNLNQDITHYVLYYKDEKSPWLEISFPASSFPLDESSSSSSSSNEARNEYELINLESGKWYQIYLRAVSKKGASDPSEILTIRTESNSNGHLSGDTFSASPFAPSMGPPYDERYSSSGRSLSGSLSKDPWSPTAITFNDWPTPTIPFFLKSSFILPLSVAVVIVTIACSVAYVYIKSAENKAALIRSAYSSRSPSTRNFTYLGLPMSSSGSPNSSNIPSGATSIVSEEGTITLRYSDSNGRLLLARPPVPTVLWAASQGPIMEEEGASDIESMSPYSTLPNFDPRFKSNCNITVNRLSSFNPIPPELPPPNKPNQTSNCNITNHHHTNLICTNENDHINNKGCKMDNSQKRTSIVAVDVHDTSCSSGTSESDRSGPLITFSSTKS